jgi:hypothetical protein
MAKEKLARVCIDFELVCTLFPALENIDSQISRIAENLHPETFKALKDTVAEYGMNTEYIRKLYLLHRLLTNIYKNNKAMTVLLEDIVNDKKIFGLLDGANFYHEEEARKRGITKEGIFDIEKEYQE